MIRRFVDWCERKTGVYLHPRFVLFASIFVAALIIFAVASFFSNRYIEQVQPMTPWDKEGERAQYDARMKAGILPQSVRP